MLSSSLVGPNSVAAWLGQTDTEISLVEWLNGPKGGVNAEIEIADDVARWFTIRNQWLVIQIKPWMLTTDSGSPKYVILESTLS